MKVEVETAEIDSSLATATIAFMWEVTRIGGAASIASCHANKRCSGAGINTTPRAGRAARGDQGTQREGAAHVREPYLIVLWRGDGHPIGINALLHAVWVGVRCWSGESSNTHLARTVR